jgi:hypothetical protein
MTAPLEALALVERLRPVLAGHSADVQSAALAHCVALWLRGHSVGVDLEATQNLRNDLLAEFAKLVRNLTGGRPARPN